MIARLLITRGLGDSFEVSGYALAACIGLGLAFTVTTKANIRVDFLTAKLPFALRAAFDLLAASVLAVVALALAWFAYGTVAQSVAMNAKSISQLQVPMVIPQGIWWLGLVWFAIVAVLAPLQAIRSLIWHDRPGFEARIGSADVQQEISQSGLKAQKDQT
ncbi:MAG: TRAP transporter small permease [Rhodobacterales bacterium]